MPTRYYSPGVSTGESNKDFIPEDIILYRLIIEQARKWLKMVNAGEKNLQKMGTFLLYMVNAQGSYSEFEN